MNQAATEIRRMHYLQAMGIDAYVSRQQLAGAAVTQRLAIVPAQNQVPVAAPSAARAEAPARGPAPQMPRVDIGDKPRPKPTAVEAPAAPAKPAASTPAVRFSLGVIIFGDVGWVEALEGYPLAREQVQLVHAMARAVGALPARPLVAQFDWPMHNNPQLDQGEETARASLAAYLERHLGEASCHSLVSLGGAAAKLMPVDALGGFRHVATLGTREMLDNPACKRQVWSDLQAIVGAASAAQN